MAATTAVSKRARQQRVVDLLARRSVRSQPELADLLAAEGVHVTQATLSRDLVDVAAVRVRAGDGGLVYAVPGEGGDRSPQTGTSASAEHRLGRLCAELLVSARASANLVVLRTPPGAAQFLASAVDHADRPEILGTIAGDDTVVLVASVPSDGDRVAAWFLALAAGARQDPEHPGQPPGSDDTDDTDDTNTAPDTAPDTSEEHP